MPTNYGELPKGYLSNPNKGQLALTAKKPAQNPKTDSNLPNTKSTKQSDIKKRDDQDCDIPFRLPPIPSLAEAESNDRVSKWWNTVETSGGTDTCTWSMAQSHRHINGVDFEGEFLLRLQYEYHMLISMSL